MVNSLYIYHHLGLGDHIVCNGIVNFYAEKYDRIFLFSKTHNLKNVAYLYRDNSKIKLIHFENDIGVKQFLRMNSGVNSLVVGITRQFFHDLDVAKIYDTFDDGFYKVAKIRFLPDAGDLR